MAIICGKKERVLEASVNEMVSVALDVDTVRHHVQPGWLFPAGCSPELQPQEDNGREGRNFRRIDTTLSCE